MNYRSKKAVLSILFVLHWLSWSAAMGSQEPCRVRTKSNHLAMDQRDDLRLKCLGQKKNQLTISQCLKIAGSMEYSTNAEEARLLCLNELRQIPTQRECFSIAKQMEYPDSGDDARWECLRRHNKTITIKQCQNIARSMSYPANIQRASAYCSQELE